MEATAQIKTSRRTVVLGLGGAGVAAILPRPLFALDTAPASTGPVHHVLTGISSTQASRVLPQLRGCAGCIGVKLLSSEDGKVSVWQEWQTSDACSAFWSSSELPNDSRQFEKLTF